MSREQYTPPTTTGAGGSSSQQNYTGGGFNVTGSSNTNTFDDTTKPVYYLCADCDSRVQLKKGDAIRCKECGYMVLYKERTTR